MTEAQTALQAILWEIEVASTAAATANAAASRARSIAEAYSSLDRQQGVGLAARVAAENAIKVASLAESLATACRSCADDIRSVPDDSNVWSIVNRAESAQLDAVEAAAEAERFASECARLAA